MAIEIYGIPILIEGEVHLLAVDRETFLAHLDNILTEKY
jgi:hypothetical protein